MVIGQSTNREMTIEAVDYYLRSILSTVTRCAGCLFTVRYVEQYAWTGSACVTTNGEKGKRIEYT